MTEAPGPRPEVRSDRDDGEALDAFICYSRRNVEFCRRLEKALEDFRPPKGLPGSGRRLRVFRDEDDFVGPDYYRAIQGFLARSRKLVVVCSPPARASEYTNDEIRRFVELHGTEDLVVVLVDGIPNNEAGPDQEDLKAFPEALCEAVDMPLAISWAGFDPASDRVDRGRFTGSWYALLAGLLDVDRGVVEQRDQKRAGRRRRILGSVTAAVMVALAGLSGWALAERETARAAELAAEDSARVAQAQRDTAQEQRMLALAAERAAADSAAVAQEQRAVADAERIEAEAQRRAAEAQRAEAWTRLLAAQAAEFAAGDPALLPRAMLLAVEALRIGPDEVAAGVLRAGLATLSPLRAVAGAGRRVDRDGGGPCGALPPGVEVRMERAERIAQVVRPDGGVELLTHDGPLTHCTFLPDQRVATYSSWVELGAGTPLDGDETVRVWDPPPPVFRLSPEGSAESELVATAFSPTDPLLATSRLRTGTVEVFDLRTGRRVAQLEVGRGETVSHLAFSADGRTLASAQIYGSTYDAWRVDGFEKVGSFDGSWGEGTVQLAPDGSLLVTRRGGLVGDGKGLVRELPGGRPLAFPAGGDTLLARPTLTLDGTRLVTVREDDTLTLWDVKTRTPIDSVRGVRYFGIGHDALWLTVPGADGSDEILRWSMVPGRRPVPPGWQDHGCLAFGPAPLAVRCTPEGLLLFDNATGRSLRLLDQSTGIASIGFSPDGRWVAGASYDYGGQAHTGLAADNILRVWEVASGSVMASLSQQGLVRGLGFSRDGRYLASSAYLSEESGFAPAAVWLWRPEALVEAACRSLSRNLTLAEWRAYVPGNPAYRATCPDLPPTGMISAPGAVAEVDARAERVGVETYGFPDGGYCSDSLWTTPSTRFLVPSDEGGWRRAAATALSPGDPVVVYLPRTGSGECPADGVPVAVVARMASLDDDGSPVAASLRAAVEALDGLEGWDARLDGEEAGRAPWERIARAGVCEPEAAADFRGGLRTLYCSLHRAGFLDWFLADAPTPPFVSGPHQGGQLDLRSDQFGRYDPAFVRWAAERLVGGLSRPGVRTVARTAYRPWTHLGTTYRWALEYLDENPELDRTLQDAVAAGETDLWDRLEGLRESTWRADLPGDWAAEVATVAVLFWVRRGVDGSRPAFREALEGMLAVLDPESGERD